MRTYRPRLIRPALALVAGCLAIPLVGVPAPPAWSAPNAPAAHSGADSAPPDREMLRMMDLLRDMEMIKQIDMLQDMPNLEQPDTAAKSASARKPLPTKQKESAK